MSEARKFRRLDGIVLFSYPLLPIVYFAAAAATSAARVPSWPTVVMLLAAAGSLVILPVWTIVRVLRSKAQISIALVVGLAAVWISAGVYAALLDSLRAFLSMVVAALAGAVAIYCSRVMPGNPPKSSDFAIDQANSANPTASN